MSLGFYSKTTFCGFSIMSFDEYMTGFDRLSLGKAETLGISLYNCVTAVASLNFE